ncbi:MAG: pyruvate kinase, partial [Patescibacteria group bacterium]
MTNSKAQIIATIGPASGDFDTLEAMILHGLDVVRINFSWGDFQARTKQIEFVRELEKKHHRQIPIIIDLPGPRVQGEQTHTYDPQAPFSVTEHDKEFIKFAVDQSADYVAVSFVRDAQDILKCREVIS